MFTSARCVNAWGKFPSSRPACGSYSSDDQAEVVAEVDQPPEELVRLVVAAEQLVAVAQPERARQEHAFARRQPVGAGRAVRRAVFRPGAAGFAGGASSHSLERAIAEHESVLEQLSLHRLDRSADRAGRSPAGSR